jgi:ATP-dependent Zn protease
MGTGFQSLRMQDDQFSEHTRRMRDEEVRELADEAFRAAVDLLDTHRALLDAMAATLLAKEVMERRDIDGILAGVPKARPDRRPTAPFGVAAATAVKTPLGPRRRDR